MTHPLGVLAVAFLPDGVLGLSSGVDDTTRIWDLRSGRLVREFKGARYKFTNVVFTSDGVHALSNPTEHPVFWDVTTGAPLRELVAPDSNETRAVTLSRDGQRAASASPGHVFVWNLERGTLVSGYPVRGDVLSIAFDDDERMVTFVTDSAWCRIETQGGTEPTCIDFPRVALPLMGASQPGDEIL